MEDELSAALGALEHLRFTDGQRQLMADARRSDPKRFDVLVEHAQTAANPAASMIVGCRNMLVEAEGIEQMRTSMSAGQSEKRVRSALNYSQTGLGLIPVAEQEDDLRDNFPWLAGELLGRCLLIGKRAWDLQQADQSRVLREANDRVVWRENLEAQKREEREAHEKERERRLETGQTAGVADVADVADEGATPASQPTP